MTAGSRPSTASCGTAWHGAPSPLACCRARPPSSTSAQPCPICAGSERWRLFQKIIIVRTCVCACARVRACVRVGYHWSPFGSHHIFLCGNPIVGVWQSFNPPRPSSLLHPSNGTGVVWSLFVLSRIAALLTTLGPHLAMSLNWAMWLTHPPIGCALARKPATGKVFAPKDAAKQSSPTEMEAKPTAQTAIRTHCMH